MFFRKAVKPESKVLTEIKEIRIEVEDVTAEINFTYHGVQYTRKKEFIGVVYFNPMLVCVSAKEIHHNGVMIQTGEDLFRNFTYSWMKNGCTILGDLSVPFAKYDYSVLTRIQSMTTCRAVVLAGSQT